MIQIDRLTKRYGRARGITELTLRVPEGRPFFDCPGSAPGCACGDPAPAPGTKRRPDPGSPSLDIENKFFDYYEGRTAQ